MQQPPHNPYAAPIATQQAAAPNVYGTPAGWEIGEVYSRSWEIFKLHWVPLIFGPFLGNLVVYVVAAIPQVALSVVVEEGSLVAAGASLLGGMIQIAAGAFINVGVLRLYLAAARGQQPTMGLMFGGADRFLPMLGFTFAQMAVLLLGLLALIVPFFILLYGFMLGSYQCVDQNRGPIESLKASWALTSGHKAQLWLLSLVASATMVVGILACGIGMIVAMVLYYLALAIVYTRLTGTQDGGAGASAGYPQPVMPAGGYHPPHGSTPGGGYGSPPRGGYGGGTPPGG